MKITDPPTIQKLAKLFMGTRCFKAWEFLINTVQVEPEPYLDSNYSSLLPEETDDVPNNPLHALSTTETGMPIPESTAVSPLPGTGYASASLSEPHKHHVSVHFSSTALQPHFGPIDLIGSPEANPSDIVPEKPLFCSSLVCEEDRENDILLQLRLETRNIVLDSLYPHIAPHIVITPPISYADDFCTPNQNRVDSQWPCFLAVPHISPPEFYHHCSVCDLNDSKSHSDVRSKTPARVSSNQRLLFAVEISSTERLISHEMVDANSRHHHKALAFEASLLAPAACARFNEWGAISRLEQPFLWTDPAQPILLASRYFSGISIIESDCPFRAPHIMITDASLCDPWISWSNRVEDQDYDYLPVYPKRSSSPRINNSALDVVSAPALHFDQDDPDGFSSHLNHSWESHLIPSPLDDSGCILTVASHETCELTADVIAFRLETTSAGLSTIHCQAPVPDFDDDDLPPFDDWYLSIIERSTCLA